MSILIKGMEMPEGGYRTIEIAYDADGHPMAIADGGDVFDVIPVPEHGRLIDASALLQSIKEARKSQPEIADVYDDDYFLVAEWVRSSPTIITAEEGEG